MTQPMDPGLRVHALSFWYPGRPLFDGFDQHFSPGLTWVRGANGCGKSTLLRLLGGALEPVAGQRWVDGVEAAADPLAYRRAVFWCGPDGVAFDHLSPSEYFGFLAGLYPAFDRAALQVLVADLGLAPWLGTRIRALSTGTQRKVAVAAALCSGARVLLLDEPLAGLDRDALACVRQHLATLAARQQQVLVVTSHDGLGDAAQALARTLALDLPHQPVNA